MEEVIKNSLILIGQSFWLIASASQLAKIHKTHDSRGLYPYTVTLNAAGNIAWATYFASNHLWFPFAINTAMFVLTIAILGHLLVKRKNFIEALIAILIIGPLTSYALFSFTFLSGWLGVVFNAIAATPWVVHVVRTRRVKGLSEQSLWLAFGATVCTFIYSILIWSLPLIVGCLKGFLYSSIVIWFYYQYRSSRRSGYLSFKRPQHL